MVFVGDLFIYVVSEIPCCDYTLNLLLLFLHPFYKQAPKYSNSIKHKAFQPIILCNDTLFIVGVQEQ